MESRESSGGGSGATGGGTVSRLLSDSGGATIRLRAGGHVDLFWQDPEDEKGSTMRLEHTSRPCARCGLPLVGTCIEGRGGTYHFRCRKTGYRG